LCTEHGGYPFEHQLLVREYRLWCVYRVPCRVRRTLHGTRYTHHKLETHAAKTLQNL